MFTKYFHVAECIASNGSPVRLNNAIINSCDKKLMYVGVILEEVESYIVGHSKTNLYLNKKI